MQFDIILSLPFQEAKLVLVPSEECKKIQHKNVKYVPKKELCAGNRFFRRIDAYRYYPKSHRPKANKYCPYCPEFQRVKLADRKEDTEVKYGLTDACGGDSGGPLWKWMGKKKPRARFLHLLSYISFSSIQITLIFRISFGNIKRLT